MNKEKLFLKTKNLISLIWQLTNYPPYGDIPVYVQVQDKIYPIRSVDCLKNLNGDDNGLVINISNIAGGEIPKDCITCGNNVFGECYHYKPYKNVLENQLHCNGKHWKPIKRGVKK